MENTTTTTTTAAARMTRSRDRIIAGVCGGLARYSNVDPAIVRLAFIVFAFRRRRIDPCLHRALDRHAA
jgi:uncharacterized membrane protein